jgi:hypothetical protein
MVMPCKCPFCVACFNSQKLVSSYKSKRRYLPEDNIDIFTAVRTSDLLKLLVFILEYFENSPAVTATSEIVIKETLRVFKFLDPTLLSLDKLANFTEQSPC